MRELVVHFESNVLADFVKLKNLLCKQNKNISKCITFFCENEESFKLLIALPEKDFENNLVAIKKAICNCVTNEIKPRYFLKKLKGFSVCSNLSAILFQTLLNFDSQNDEKNILENITLLNNFYFDSFVNFKLNFITKKWQEMCDLINENGILLQNEQMQIEFIKFLLSGANFKHKKMTIFVENDMVLFTSEKNEKIVIEKPFYLENAELPELFLSTVFKNYPKELEILGYKNFSANLINTLFIFFGINLKLV